MGVLRNLTMQYISYYFFEIQWRILYLFLSFWSCFVLCYKFKYQYIYLVGKPLFEYHQQFIWLNFTEGLTTVLYLSAGIAFIAIIPSGMYQWWCFIAPSWYSWERQFWTPRFWNFVIWSGFQALGIYLVIIPLSCQFFLSFQYQECGSGDVFCVEYLPRLSTYITAFLWVFSLCLLSFQVPRIGTILLSQKIVDIWVFCNSRWFAFFGCILFSALIAPPDLLIQFLLTGLFYLMYELTIFFCFLEIH